MPCPHAHTPHAAQVPPYHLHTTAPTLGWQGRASPPLANLTLTLTLTLTLALTLALTLSILTWQVITAPGGSAEVIPFLKT